MRFWYCYKNSTCLMCVIKIIRAISSEQELNVFFVIPSALFTSVASELSCSYQLPSNETTTLKSLSQSVTNSFFQRRPAWKIIFRPGRFNKDHFSGLVPKIKPFTTRLSYLYHFAYHHCPGQLKELLMLFYNQHKVKTYLLIFMCQDIW